MRAGRGWADTHRKDIRRVSERVPRNVGPVDERADRDARTEPEHMRNVAKGDQADDLGEREEHQVQGVEDEESAVKDVFGHLRGVRMYAVSTALRHYFSLSKRSEPFRLRVHAHTCS